MRSIEEQIFTLCMFLPFVLVVLGWPLSYLEGVNKASFPDYLPESCQLAFVDGGIMWKSEQDKQFAKNPSENRKFSFAGFGWAHGSLEYDAASNPKTGIQTAVWIPFWFLLFPTAGLVYWRIRQLQHIQQKELSKNANIVKIEKPGYRGHRRIGRA